MEEGIGRESERMGRVLAAQKDSFTAAMPESLAVRRDRIDRAIALLVDHAEDFAKAVSEDFGHRSREQTLMTDIMPSVSALKHAKKHMANWAKGERRRTTFPRGMLGATDERSEEHTSELQSLMRISYAVFCLKKKQQIRTLSFRN